MMALPRAFALFFGFLIAAPALAVDLPKPLSDAQFAKLRNREKRPMILLFSYSDSSRSSAKVKAAGAALDDFADDFRAAVGTDFVAYQIAMRANPKTTQALGIRLSPTLVLYRKKQKLAALEGVVDADFEAEKIRAWMLCGLKIDPAKNCPRESIIPKADFLQLDAIAKRAEWVLVDVSTKYCPPCRMLEPVLDEVAKGRKDLAFYATPLVQPPHGTPELDAYEELQRKYGIRGIPSLLLFHEGALVASRAGYEEWEGRKGIEGWINSKMGR